MKKKNYGKDGVKKQKWGRKKNDGKSPSRLNGPPYCAGKKKKRLRLIPSWEPPPRDKFTSRLSQSRKLVGNSKLRADKVRFAAFSPLPGGSPRVNQCGWCDAQDPKHVIGFCPKLRFDSVQVLYEEVGTQRYQEMFVKRKGGPRSGERDG